MPEGRPYSLGNTSADYASINATSEMSASSRSRGRVAENPRAVSYETDASYAPGPSSAYLPIDPRGPSEVLERPRALLTASTDPFRKAIKAALTSSGRSCCTQWPAPSRISFCLQVRQDALHLVDLLGADQAGNDAIVRSRDEQGRLMDLRTLPWRRQVPVAIEIAIPVQPAAKAGFAVDLGEGGEVGLGQPVR